MNTVDFGFARSLEENDDTYTSTGTKKTVLLKKAEGNPLYASPEIILRSDQDSKTDVFSYGLMMYEMIADRSPPDYTKDIAPRDLFNSRRTRNGLTTTEKEILRREGVKNEDLITLISDCLKKNEDRIDRPDMAEVVRVLTASLGGLRTAAED